MTIEPKPFHCNECAPYPKSAFHIFEPCQDWIMTFPDQQLVHIHFGDVAFPDAVDRAEAVDLADYYYHRIHDYPGLQFYFVIDMTNIDNSGFISDRARQIYQIILQHPQLAGGVVYGATTDMQTLIGLVSETVDKPVLLVKTAAEARAAHQTWLRSTQRQTLT